jgi:hypothetical protein
LYNLDFSWSDAGLCPYKSKVKTGVLLELICPEAVSFLEPQLPTKVASLKHTLLAQFKK